MRVSQSKAAVYNHDTHVKEGVLMRGDWLFVHSSVSRLVCLFLLVGIPSAAAQLSKDADAYDAATRQQLYNQLDQEAAQLARFTNVVKTVVRLATPSVVHLESYRSDVDPVGHRAPVEEAGSGIVIQLDERFYVLTNRHVIQGAGPDYIRIRLPDGRHLHPEQIWTDAETDVAVIRVVEHDLLAARLGDSDKLDIGDFVLAMGSPFGLSHSVSFGIISAKGRRDLDLGDQEVRLQDFLQTDAAINPGNSGGPLLNLRGEVIGIATAIASNSGGNEGVSFAIPINMFMHSARQLIERGYVSHAYLGVRLDRTFDLDKAKQLGLDRLRGALVKGVTARSPADSADLREQDVIVRYNGIPVEDDDHLVNLVSMTPIDETVTIELIRDRQLVRMAVKLGNRRQFEGGAGETR